MFSGCSYGSCGPGGNESMDFIDAKEFDDPQLFDERQLFDDQLEVWTLIIQKSTVIPPSPMVLF